MMTPRPIAAALDRRGFVSGLGAAALAAATPGHAARSERGFVASESGRLHKVLVHADEVDAGLLAGGDPFWLDAAAVLSARNADMVQALEAAGASVLQFEDVLGGAIRTARGRGVFDGWLAARFPELAAQPRATAGMLFGRTGGWRHRSHAPVGLRDCAVMLPPGLVLSNSADPGLARFEDLVRFALRHAPELRGYRVAFDARARGARLEAGDVVVLDRQTLLVGVGNHTAAEAAPALARATGLETIAVTLGRERGVPHHLDQAAVALAADRVLLHPSFAGAPVAVHRGGEAARLHSNLAEQLGARGMRVDVASTAGALGILPTAPGAVLTFAAGRALLPRGVSAKRVGADEAWLSGGGPQRLALALERS
jgi:N-dimethylarginine dimethylaminohydrolase